jgi:hypothetical protein
VLERHLNSTAENDGKPKIKRYSTKTLNQTSRNFYNPNDLNEMHYTSQGTKSTANYHRNNESSSQIKRVADPTSPTTGKDTGFRENRAFKLKLLSHQKSVIE